ncbi:hypothetical protein NC653_035465 [Populus alba x Populus x berolinensis]|uniref:Uncharacterized protein n=1 Tax=Populus alba x Populus x berolinensis TaxID=444605 RepID=A0AAD6PXC5_9ROSI|nr:hypothetical protein NC653_035465 [Populus alba x Populus x berolinensis]
MEQSTWTRSSTRGRYKNETKTALFHGRRRGSMGVTVFNCILEDDVALFVYAMKAS